MQRYFIPDNQVDNHSIRIKGEDARHITKVMRMKTDDEIICCNYSGQAFYCRIDSILENEVTAEVIHPLEADHELPIKVAIVQGLPKGDKLDTIVQKATELGADTFFLFQAERSIVKWVGTSKIERKQERLQKIAKEAAEQSHRNKVPVVTEPMSLKELLKRSSDFDQKVVAYEEVAKQGEMSGLSGVFKAMKPCDSLMVVIGPEGGLSEAEVTAFDNAGFVRCALGKRILRTETASMYVLSAASYYFELENEVN
jgi:16S rRNA (uracil1498-N3)-methyltransferase